MATLNKCSIASAAANGDLSGIKYLLNQGEDINLSSNDGMTPLAIAAFWGYSDIVLYLLEQGANINKCNKGTNWTPLHCAAFQGHGKVIMYLMQFKPDLFIKDNKGRTAVDFASALDSVWSFFAAAGCSRTPKSELIKSDIVRKISNQECKKLQTDKVYFSRPGSAYVLTNNSHSDKILGDVLGNVADEHNSYKPSLQVLRN